MGHVFYTCHQICIQQVFLQYFFKCSMLFEHPCAQVPLDYTEGYDPELQCRSICCWLTEINEFYFGFAFFTCLNWICLLDILQSY